MTDITHDGNAAAEESDAMREAMARLMGDFSLASPKKAERKRREKKARSLVDGRTLKAKGRTEQLNVKVRPDVKQALTALAEADGISITDWLERTVEEKRGAKGAEHADICTFFQPWLRSHRDCHRGPVRIQDER